VTSSVALLTTSGWPWSSRMSPRTAAAATERRSFGGRGGLELGPGAHLQVPEPAAEGGQQREHEDLDHAEARAGAVEDVAGGTWDLLGVRAYWLAVRTATDSPIAFAGRGEQQRPAAVGAAGQRGQAGEHERGGDGRVERAGRGALEQVGAAERAALAEQAAEHGVAERGDARVDPGDRAGAQRGAVQVGCGATGDRADQREDDGVPSGRGDGGRGEVRGQPGAESGERAEVRTPGDAERDHGEQHEVWLGVRQVQLRKDAELQANARVTARGG